MRRLSIIASILLGLLFAASAFGQDASLGGTVTDASGSVIARAKVTATNEGTGVAATSVTNAAGVYSFPRLLFGAYTVKAEQQGFQAKTFTKVPLEVGQQARLNFQLEISGVSTSVEVTSSGEQMLLESGSSVGDVLPEKTVQELPLVNRNALDLIKIMSGVVVTDDAIFGANNTTFAGVSASAVNVQMDGVTVNDVRWPTGINTPTRINPDLVGEFKMVLSPVDAEVGRGNAQVQIATKSGGNKFHGSAVWNVQNTALDPNTWNNNRTGAVPPWRNLQEGTISAGGPIIKNKTFFFALFNGQVAKRREPYTAMSLTPCARKGIFRFWDRWNNSNRLYVADATTSAGTNPQIAAVDANGNPLRPQWEPGRGNWEATQYTGQLRYASVFGTIANLDTLAPDCSNAQITGSWDPRRPGMDPSGFIADFLEKLPPVNNYDVGDGLNTAGYRWSRTAEGAENLFGVGEDTYRKHIDVRIDHNFSPKHRISGYWSFEKNHADDTLKTWPTNSWSGGGIRQPQVLTVSFVSSIRPTLLNEFKFGMSRTGSNVYSPATRPSNGDALQNYLAQFGTLPNGEVSVIEPGLGLTGSFRTDGPGSTASTPYGTRGGWAIADMRDTSPRYSWGDTVTWVKSAHSLRFGGEIRRNSSYYQAAWFGLTMDSFPQAKGGELPLTPQTYLNVVGDLAGSSSSFGNKRAFRDLLIFLSGSLQNITQGRYINSINNINNATWNDPLKDPYMVRNTIMKEFSLFAKDDWKVSPALTLNLGVRYDYYGVPFLDNGMTVGLTGGGGAIFGPSGGYSNWFAPINKGDTAPGSLLSLRSIGPAGQHSDELLFPQNWKNIGPAVGFAYELPWFGKGKTTIRGGYQLSYISMAGNFSAVQGAAGQSPGFSYSNTWNNNNTWDTIDPNSYFGIKDLKANPVLANGVPILSAVVPGLTTFTLYDRQQSISAYAPDYKYPYVQNLTFAITRNVTSNLTVDLRYIGTLTRHNFSSKNINAPNFLTNGLLQAFDAARRGEDPVLLDQLLNGLPIPGVGNCTVNGTTCKGGAALRAANSFTQNLPFGNTGAFTNMNVLLAQGNYQGLANQINVLSGPGAGYTSRGQFLETNGFPVNFIKASPQFANATLYGNQGYANYHSFQAQVTLRPTHGIYFQSTYTWSKNLANSGGLSPDPRDLRGLYILSGSDRPHNFVTYGTFELPFGPGKLLGTSTYGALAKAIGGWQLGWITTVQSGAPLNLSLAGPTNSGISADGGLYSLGTPDIVNGGIDPNSIGVFWPSGAAKGSLFANRYLSVKDPQCTNGSIVAPTLLSLCTLQAVVDSKTNNVVVQNALPGKKGTMGYNAFRNLARWNVDMSLSKSVAISETKSFRLRADITNIFNHPLASGALGFSGTRITFPTAPSMSINGTDPIGLFNYKVGGRTLQAMLRFDF